MTLTVALDTATDFASLAVGEGTAVLAELTLGPRRHASALLPAVEEALRLAGARIPDVGRILLADGPGSFTGLRIGVATAQGLRRGRPAITVGTAPSLLASAWTGARFAGGPVAAVYDALRGDVFAAVYAFDHDGVRTLLPPSLAPLLTTVEALVAACPVVPRLGIGDGAAKYPEAIRAWTGRDPVAPPAGAPRAAALLALDGVRGGVRTIEDPATFEPDYGRPAEAQARWERAHGRQLPDAPGQPR
jgi:tRNA threonylcarbamoyl adenosine modification protein YeaZ